MGVKSFLAYTNPLVWPVGVGVIASGVLYNAVSGAVKAVKAVSEDLE